MKGWDNALQIDLDIPEEGRGSLEESLNQRFLKTETLGDYRCDNCKHMGADKQDRFARCPEILIFMLRRHGFNKEQNLPYKKQGIVTFPLNNFSLDPYCISLDGRGSEELDKGFLKPFIYDCYAVIQHRGDEIKAGHYWTLVKERDAGTGGREQWFRYNDSILETVENIKKATMTNAESYLLFYERRRVLGKQ
jgi:ubiquitin C-terminal hydrolase